MMTFSTIRLSTVLVACLLSAQAALVERQTPPSCTVTCMTRQDRSACTSNSDNKCLCKQPAFTFNMYTCLTDECATGDLSSAIQAVEGMCRINGASVTLGPGGGSSPTTSGPQPSNSGTTGGQKGAAITNKVNPWLIVTAAGILGIAL